VFEWIVALVGKVDENLELQQNEAVASVLHKTQLKQVKLL